MSQGFFYDFYGLSNFDHLVHQQAVLRWRSRLDNQSRNEGVSLQGEEAGGEECEGVTIHNTVAPVQGEAGARLLVKSPALSEVDSEWAAMEEELAGAGAM